MKIQGINPAVIAAYARAHQPSSPAESLHSGVFAVDAPTPAQATSTTGGMARLVAGKVASGVNRGEGFDQVPPKAFPRQTLQLYSSSAERVEAATRVAVGRILDTTA